MCPQEPVLYYSVVLSLGGALVIPVEDECMVIQTKYFLPDPRGAGSRRLRSILNVYVLHFTFTKKKYIYIYIERERERRNKKKKAPEISSGS